MKAQLQHKKILLAQISAAQQRWASCPAVLRALIGELGLSSSYVARCIGVADCTLSNWTAGRAHVSDIHHNRLTALLRQTIIAAEGIGQKDKVKAAYAILQELEPFNG